MTGSSDADFRSDSWQDEHLRCRVKGKHAKSLGGAKSLDTHIENGNYWIPHPQQSLAMRYQPAVRLVLAMWSVPASIALSQTRLGGVDWSDGPTVGALGSVAKVDVPAGCHYTAKAGARQFMIATENPPSGDEEGVLLCGDSASGWWFVVFSFDESGLVKDDEGKSLDAPKLLERLREGNEEGNKVRREKGWSTLEILGWKREPYYDPRTQNLTWSMRILSRDDTSETINHSVRLLGRRGVMKADLVAGSGAIDGATVAFDSIVAGYAFLPGNKYSEWREGDAVAKYGLTALIAGGAGVAATKLGLMGKLWKLVLGLLFFMKKLVILVLLAIGAFVNRLFARKKESEAPVGVSAPSNAYKKLEAPATTAAQVTKTPPTGSPPG